MSNHCHFHRKRIAHSCGVQFILETPEDWAYSPKSKKAEKRQIVSFQRLAQPSWLLVVSFLVGIVLLWIVLVWIEVGIVAFFIWHWDVLWPLAKPI